MDARHYYHVKLVQARELQGKTQEEIADALDVHVKTICRAETGVSASYDLLARMCAYYGIPMNTIVIPTPLLAAA